MQAILTIILLSAVLNGLSCQQWQTAVFTSSYIPATMQVLSHVVTQLQYGPAKIPHRQAATVTIDIQDSEGAGRAEPRSVVSRMKALIQGLNRVAKSKDLARFQGMSNEVLHTLSSTSTMSVSEQLLLLLHKASQEDFRNTLVKKQMEGMWEELLDRSSGLSAQLIPIRPLVYLE